MKRKKFPIDLSMLTEEEIDQFREDSTTLYEGVVDVALYLRFTIERISEPYIVWGTVFVQTKRHSLS